MLNHLLMFTTEADAIDALPSYGARDPDGLWLWRDDLVIPNQRVVISRAVWDYSDPEAPLLVSPEQSVPGYFVTVTLPGISADLRDLPGAACRLIGDATTGAIVYTAADLNPGLLASAIVEPMPAGARYSLGGA